MTTPWTFRRRRRRGLWTAVALTVTALAFLGMGTVRSETRALAAYLDTVRSIADTQARLASTFQDVVVRLDQLERTALVAALTDLEVTADEAVAQLSATERPPGSADAHGFLSVALGSWRDGLSAFAEALLLVVDDPDNPQAAVQLEQALFELAVGDRAYGRFRTLAHDLRHELDVEASELREVRFLPEGGVSVASVVERARAAERLALRRDLAVAVVRLDPGPVGERDGVPLVPPSDVFNVQVGVINQGNQTEYEVVVNLRLEWEGRPPHTAEAVIAELAPGASQTVTFEAVPVPVGEVTNLVVTVQPVEGETSVEDNTHQPLRFVRDPNG